MAGDYGGSGEVRYTVKELIDQMRREQREAHRELVEMVSSARREIREVRRRVDSLEDERERRAGAAAMGGRLWLVSIALGGVVVNIPAMLYYLTGGAH